ncbi:cytochrome P450 [Xylaria sp. FL1777]|nr:cytochrome P450 [Xylaria sp. FL1777]
MALTSITTTLFGLILAYIIWTAITLQLNLRKARAIGVPCICIPIDANSVLWAAIQPFVWSILDRLPFKWTSYPDFIRYIRRGWPYTDRSETHLRLGPVWALVTPVTMYLYVADPNAIREIFARRSDFVRPLEEYKLLEVYGPCISSAGHDWARHRKVLAAPFNESIMEFVWNESLRQARSMLRSWTSVHEPGITSMQRDTRTLSLNVLASAAFRKSYKFHGSAEPAIDEASSYRDSLQIVLDNIVPLMIIPYGLLASPIVPKSWARVGKAAASFKEHMRQMLEKETATLKQGEPGSGGIITPFAHALQIYSQDTKASELGSNKVKRGLSMDEIFGNMFVINFAGHDTTAVTFSFSMILLAANPSVQEWISEEISAVTKDIPLEEWDYKTLFPALKRCRAVMLETLRVYPPIMLLPKLTFRTAQTIPVGDQTLVIPPNVNTTICLKAVQSHPDYWPDPDTWNPSRWISQTATGLNEELLEAKPNTYFPWSDGPQKCPGRKFSEVEAVAVLACLFKKHRLHVKKKAYESDEAAKQRLMKCTQDVCLEALLKMTNPDQVTLICKEV